MEEFDQKVPLDSKKNEESVTAVFQSVWEIFTLNLAVLSDLSMYVQFSRHSVACRPMEAFPEE